MLMLDVRDKVLTLRVQCIDCGQDPYLPLCSPYDPSSIVLDPLKHRVGVVEDSPGSMAKSRHTPNNIRSTLEDNMKPFMQHETLRHDGRSRRFAALGTEHWNQKEKDSVRGISHSSVTEGGAGS